MRVAIAFLLVFASTAHADRSYAEQLAREARDDPDKAVACGQAYLDVYTQDPAAPDGDELLYNAAACFDEGKSIGAAIQTLDLMRRSTPRSRLLPRAITRLANLHARIASYADAAALYEEYATKYAGEKDAVQALSEAVYLRAALGDDTKLVSDVQFFIRTFGAKRPAEASDAHLKLVPVMERKGPDAVITHLREHLRRFKIEPARAIMVHARLGVLLWQRACPIKTIDGLCLKAVRPAAARTCNPTAGAKLVPVPRDARLAKEAAAALTAARTLQERANVQDPATGYFAGQARLALADAELESYLAVQFPAGLDFDPEHEGPRKTSQKRFDKYLADKTRLGSKARQSYEAVLGLKDPASSVAAAARLGQLTQAFATQVVTAEIPRDVRTPPYAAEKTSAFCDQMVLVGQPLAAQAREAFEVCAAKASELGVLDDFARLCHRERERIDPAMK